MRDLHNRILHVSLLIPTWPRIVLIETPGTLGNWNQDHFLPQLIAATEQSLVYKCSSRCRNAKFLTKKDHL